MAGQIYKQGTKQKENTTKHRRQDQNDNRVTSYNLQPMP